MIAFGTFDLELFGVFGPFLWWRFGVSFNLRFGTFLSWCFGTFLWWKVFWNFLIFPLVSTARGRNEQLFRISLSVVTVFFTFFYCLPFSQNSTVQEHANSWSLLPDLPDKCSVARKTSDLRCFEVPSALLPCFFTIFYCVKFFPQVRERRLLVKFHNTSARS